MGVKVGRERNREVGFRMGKSFEVEVRVIKWR